MNRREFVHGLTVLWISSQCAGFEIAAPSTVKSADGTHIAVETSGKGSRLVLVHGGVGDHTRWQKVVPLFASSFRVSAMDRRGHGASAEGTNYSIRKEAEDIVAVINSQHGKVNLVGHSYGAICSFEAAFLTSKISKLVLYEPPFMQTIDPAIPTKMESLIGKNQREDALVLFLTEVVKVPPQEIAAARKSPTWANRVAAIHNSVRETRALIDYKLDAARAATLRLPTLLLTGSETARHHTESINALARALPDRRTYVFKGQGHNAIDTVPEEFVKVVSAFVAG